MSKSKASTPMNPKAASRIQSAADRSGKNAGFKARAQSTAAKNGGQSGGKAKGN